MPVGNGRYGDIAERVAKETNASTAIVMIIAGDKGHGFSVASDIPGFDAKLPMLLRITADSIEKENALSLN